MSVLSSTTANKANARPLTLPAIAVRRPESSPPPPIDTEAALVIPPDTMSFPEAPKASRAAPTASTPPSTPIAAAKKRKRPATAAVVISPGSPRTAPLKRPPLSPSRTVFGHYASSCTGGRTVRAKLPDRSSSRRPLPLRQHDVLFDNPPWTDAREARTAAPSPPNFPTVPDLLPVSARRPAAETPADADAKPSAGVVLSLSVREVECGSARRTAELLRMLAPPPITEEGYDQDMIADGEEEEDLVGLKYVSFGEEENDGSLPPLH